MNTLMKVRMLGGDSERGRERGREYTRSEGRSGDYRSDYGGEHEPLRSAYEPIENRFRDRTGREHYDNGRFAPMRSAYESGSSGTYGGGYDSPRMGDDDEEYRRKWTIIENRSGGYESPQYRGEMNDDGMRRIYGFGMMAGDRGPQANYQGPSREAEMGWRGGTAERGYSQSQMIPPMTREMAEEWMASIKNEDGTVGPHWTLEQVKQLMQQKGIQGDPVRVWVAINAEYSDIHMVNKKYGVDRPEYYLDAAIARWLNDADAVKNKDSAYYLHVVRH